jgi:hypothetical protein
LLVRVLIAAADTDIVEEGAEEEGKNWTARADPRFPRKAKRSRSRTTYGMSKFKPRTA